MSISFPAPPPETSLYPSTVSVTTGQCRDSGSGKSLYSLSGWRSGPLKSVFPNESRTDLPCTYPVPPLWGPFSRVGYCRLYPDLLFMGVPRTECGRGSQGDVLFGVNGCPQWTSYYVRSDGRKGKKRVKKWRTLTEILIDEREVRNRGRTKTLWGMILSVIVKYAIVQDHTWDDKLSVYWNLSSKLTLESKKLESLPLIIEGTEGVPHLHPVPSLLFYRNI